MADRTPEDAAEQGSSNPGVARGSILKYAQKTKAPMAHIERHSLAQYDREPMPYMKLEKPAEPDSGGGPG
jgi:hypothetical protein